MFHMMIYMYKKAGSYDKARQLFALMPERGVQKTTVTYNSLMSFETNYKEVSKIYDQMQRAGIRPDVVSYALLINAYGKARREEEALAVFEEMLDAGVRPTQKAYNILLDAFAISGMVEQARIVFKSMRRDRCTPDLCSYTTMLSAYVNSSDMDGAEKFFRRIKQDGFEPNVVTYGTLIKGYAKINNLEEMMEKYNNMRVQGIKPNQTILTTIMDAFGRNEDFSSAVIWFNDMVSSETPPDQKAKNILLSLAKTADEKLEANQLVQQADDQSPFPKDAIENGEVKGRQGERVSLIEINKGPGSKHMIINLFTIIFSTQLFFIEKTHFHGVFQDCQQLKQQQHAALSQKADCCSATAVAKAAYWLQCSFGLVYKKKDNKKEDNYSITLLDNGLFFLVHQSG
ncbi:Pentatricopeptide repeat-containing protein-like [Forsythia ovata]|uniref:Pentatricopeptide repeat-containing protein-like n=1 Tax=Forsythia ovata TaxID=205694 RepID=A0ABD1S0H3_9LAMI